jgi:hypothetical protein
MKKSLLIVAAVLALVACKKTAPKEFSFITNPFIRAAEVGSGPQEFGFATSGTWTITWDPVEWVSIDESQFAGKACKHLGEYYIIQMTVEPNRKNEDRSVEFVVHSEGKEHIQKITQLAPTLPREPLVFSIKESGKDVNAMEGGEYSFEAPEKYEITVKASDGWIVLGDIDYEKNLIKFSVEALPEDVESREGKIETFLSDGMLLGSLLIKQTR